MKVLKIFFQGDSITDCERNREDNHNLSGYTQMIKNALGNKFEYVNYAISGDTSAQMIARHESEIIKEKPDIFVLMIGVNDLWRRFDGYPQMALFPLETLSNVVKSLGIVKTINPECKTVLLEPYILTGPANLKEPAEGLYKELISLLRKNVKPIVDSYIELNDEMTLIHENKYLLSDDGVHPNLEGNKFIANKVVEYLKTL